MNRKICKHCNISFYRHGAGSDIPNDSCAWCYGNFKAEANESDPVNNPAHYQSESGIECIDAIRAALTPEEFRGYCKGNIFKYLWRHDRKNGAEDVRKSRWYLERLTKELEK